MIDQAANPEDCTLLKNRYRDATMIVRTPNGAAVKVRPRSGGLQGDANMAPEFSATYDPVLQEYIADKEAHTGPILTARDPVTGDDATLSITVYADDVAEVDITVTPDEAHTTSTTHNQLCNARITPHGLAQNEDKAECVPSFHVTGAVSATRHTMRDTPAVLARQYRPVARYLGNHDDATGRMQATIQKRIDAMTKNFHSISGFWLSQDVPWSLCTLIF